MVGKCLLVPDADRFMLSDGARRHFDSFAPACLSSTDTVYKLTDSGVVKLWCVIRRGHRRQMAPAAPFPYRVPQRKTTVS